MAAAATPTIDTTTAPVPLPRWSWAVLTAALLGLFLLTQENGLLLSQWETLHELVHDGRHAIGVPCH